MVKFETEILMKAESDKSALQVKLENKSTFHFPMKKFISFSDSQSCVVSLLVVSVITVRDVRTFYIFRCLLNTAYKDL